MKNIGIFHYKVGGTDGVSLESRRPGDGAGHVD
jgi:hypothetical protein